MKIPYQVGQKVKLISGNEGWINNITIYKENVTYNIWDGCKEFLNVDEWQIEKGKKKPIGFYIEFE